MTPITMNLDCDSDIFVSFEKPTSRAEMTYLLGLFREKIAEMIAETQKHLDRENRITKVFPLPISIDGLVDALKTFKTRIDELLENNEKLLEELKIAETQKDLDRENRITKDFPLPISVDGFVDALKTFKTRINELLENSEKLLEELKKEQQND